VKRIIGTAAVVAIGMAMVSAPAFAFHCPKDMAQIDAALAKHPKLSEAQLAEVKEYRAQGEALHKAGKHAESLAELAKAEKILGLQPIK
jgi:hypothetical protein